MDNKGDCCIARYERGGGSNIDMSKVHRIMLRYRPIAPKPAADGAGHDPSSANKSGDMQSKPCRGKKRHAKDNKNNTKKCNYKKRDCNNLLPLMPQAETKELDLNQKGTVWLSFSNSNKAPAKNLIRAWVIVECVMDTWVDSNALGCTDTEKMMHLESDKCPGFVSEAGVGRVTWTNAAFRRMVSQGGEGDIEVSLLMMPLVMKIKCAAFTCRVRLQYTCGGIGKDMKGSGLNSITLPCDVWRMNGGSFAWRLDVDAALCLGR